MPRRSLPASARERAAAALLLSLVLLAATLPAPPTRGAPCDDPREQVAEQGHTTVASCRARAEGRAVRGPARLLFGQPIDPNQASARTLEALPGIGPGRAAAIVAARVERPFARLADLERVPGIGPRTVSGLEGLVRVESDGRSADQ